MPKDGLTVRPWYAWNPRDFRSDPAVFNMSREERWRYRDALDDSWLSATPGVASEDQWRRWLGYTPAEWCAHRDTIAEAFSRDGDVWTQVRLHSEHEEWLQRQARSSAGGKASQAGFKSRSSGLRVHSESTPRSAVDIEAQTTHTTSGSSAPPSATQKNAAGAALDLVRGIASGTAMSEQPAGPAKLNPREIWKIATSATENAQPAVVKFVGWLAKRGATEFEVTCALQHWNNNRDTIGNPYAYFTGEQWESMRLAWGVRYTIEVDSREKALTLAWLAGR